MIIMFFQFLKSVHNEGLIEVKEYPKGTENLIRINLEHEDVKRFIVDKVGFS